MLLARGEIMGFVQVASGPQVLDGALVRAALQGLHEQGVATRVPLDRDDDSLDEAVDAALESSEHSPMPAGEWPSLLETLGEDLLSELLSISAASLRRYVRNVRPTPREVVERLHVLALIVSDLAGAYNDYGVRRWFKRPRQQLDGKSPAELLGSKWDPDGPAALRLRGLAAGLVSAGSA